MTSKSVNIWQKFLDYDQRYVIIVIFILIIISQIKPLALPVRIMKTTQWLYDGIEEYAVPGSVVIIDSSITPGGLYSSGPAFAAVAHHIFSKPGIKVIVSHFNALAPPMFDEMVRIGWINIPEGMTYGEDWVVMPYIAGMEAGYASFASDLGVSGVDFYGTPFSDLPMMQNIKTMDDVSLVFAQTSYGVTANCQLRQWAQTYGVPMGWQLTMDMLPAYMPYIPSQIFGIVAGMPGGAQYELLNSKPGESLKFTDSMSIAMLATFVGIIILNIADFRVRTMKKTEGA